MNTIPEESEFSKRQNSILRVKGQTRALLRTFLIAVGVYTIPFVLLGIHFFLICSGLFHAIIRLSPIWKPAKKIAAFTVGSLKIENPSPEKQPSKWMAVWYILSSLPWLAVAGYGVWLLIKYGFLNLNLIHMLLSH